MTISRIAVFLNMAFFLIEVAMMITGLALGEANWSTFYKANWLSAGTTILITHLAHFAASLQAVDQNRLAILLFFGRYIGNIPPGLIYAPWPLYRLVTVTKNMIEADIPASPERIFHGDLTKEGSEGIVPDGYVPAIRITFAPAKDEDSTVEVNKTVQGSQPGDKKQITIPKDDPYHRRLATEVEGSYGFRVIDLKLFYETIGTIGKARNDMNDHATAGFNSRLPKLTLAEAMLRMDELANEVKEDLTEYANACDWGIEISFFRFKPFGVSHALNTAVGNVAVAGETLKSKKKEAEGERIMLTEKGRGNANAEADRLNATAQGLREIALVASEPGGAYAMTINAAEKSLGAAKAVVVPTDNLFGAIAGAAEILKQIPTVPPQPAQLGQPDDNQDKFGSGDGQQYGSRGGKGKGKK